MKHYLLVIVSCIALFSASLKARSSLIDLGAETPNAVIEVAPTYRDTKESVVQAPEAPEELVDSFNESEDKQSLEVDRAPKVAHDYHAALMAAYQQKSGTDHVVRRRNSPHVGPRAAVANPHHFGSVEYATA